MLAEAPEIDDFFGMNIVKVKGGQPMKNCGVDLKKL